MIKAMVFDAGGVLFKNNWQAIKDEIMKLYGVSIILYSDYPEDKRKEYDEAITTGKISLKKLIKELPRRDDDKILEDYKKVYLKYQNVNDLLLGIIKKLKKKYKIFCLTNTNDLNLEINKESGLFSIFDKIYASCEIGVKKPDKKAFEFVLKDNKLKSEEVVFIDDNKKNLEIANSIGIDVILYDKENLIESLNKIKFYL